MKKQRFITLDFTNMSNEQEDAIKRDIILNLVRKQVEAIAQEICEQRKVISLQASKVTYSARSIADAIDTNRYPVTAKLDDLESLLSHSKELLMIEDQLNRLGRTERIVQAMLARILDIVSNSDEIAKSQASVNYYLDTLNVIEKENAYIDRIKKSLQRQ